MPPVGPERHSLAAPEKPSHALVRASLCLVTTIRVAVDLCPTATAEP